MRRYRTDGPGRYRDWLAPKREKDDVFYRTTDFFRQIAWIAEPREKAPATAAQTKAAPTGASISRRFRRVWTPINEFNYEYAVTIRILKPAAITLSARSQTILPTEKVDFHCSPIGMEALPWIGMAADSGTMNEERIILGEREDWGKTRLFGILIADQRHHVYVIGKTGSGKTTLMRNMIVQHIARGHGVGVLDPHGDMAEEILNHIPPHRANDLAYFNPSDFDFPVGLNMLANVEPDRRPLVASGVISALKGIWIDSWGPRLEYTLYNAVSALLDCRNATLLGVNRMLVDPVFRAKVIRQVKDPFIRAFWTEEYEKYDDRFRREVIAPVQNKLGQFFQNPAIRNILGQVKNKVDIPFVMNNSRLLIANLSKGRLGSEKADLLGSLLTTQFQLAAMARANQPESERRDFFLFVDEFQNFSTSAFATILSESRKFKLSLNLFHQYVDQLPLPIRQAVFGNVGTLISFRIGYPDAEIMENEFGHNFSAAAIADLDRYETIVRLLDGGINTQPFRARTLSPIQNLGGRKDKLIRHSRQRFSMPRAVIEAKLDRWMRPLKNP